MKKDNKIKVIRTKNKDYYKYHKKRIHKELQIISNIKGKNIVEIGGHPWHMTKEIIDKRGVSLNATVSAEEKLKWPDDIEVEKKNYQLEGASKKKVFSHYTANIERRLFGIDESPDIVVACEVIEHLLRAPHVMLLNMNKWLEKGGKIFISTPNGARFENPLRVKSKTQKYRESVYARHNYLYTMDILKDIINLCGFKVEKSKYANMYSLEGIKKLYKYAGMLPTKYTKNKFKQTIYIIAEKKEDMEKIKKYPKAYDSRGEWEHMKY